MLTAPANAFADLHDRNSTRSQLLSFYDTLPALEPNDLLGIWTGGEWRTGGRFDGLLGKTEWWGKVFRSENDVDALVFGASLRPLSLINTLMIWPFRLPENRALMRHPLGKARVREVRFRGVVSAAMCYNQLPIIDHFRRVDDEKVMGVMDFSGRRAYELFFWLRRVE
jgi:hypothetical protein